MVDKVATKSILGLAEQFLGVFNIGTAADAQASNILTAGEISAQGAEIAAQGFRQGISSQRQALTFNTGVDAINNQRRLQSTSRQFQRLLGKQITQISSSGIKGTSASALQLRNEALDTFDRTVLNLKVDAENQRRAKQFQSDLRITNLENQARAAEFRAAATRVTAKNRASEVSFQKEIASFKFRQSAIKGLPTLISQLS